MAEVEKHHADATTFSKTITKSELYETALVSASSLFDSQTFWPSNLANAASLCWYAFEALEMRVNWSGFYVSSSCLKTKPDGNEEMLLLGPFMGRVACQTIKIGRGVCGTAASTKITQVVPNVLEFPGHIACDGDTMSEVVVPLVDSEGVVRGVLDIDCLIVNGFDEVDVEFLEKLAKLVTDACEW
ncbi:GAF domain-like protein [Kockiozyma suomiensis]|uniref:GAF domain-like protein n=1 Tax=Kockiozyma suomiensis TaxID=1337062 RepID=UPI003343E7DF